MLVVSLLWKLVAARTELAHPVIAGLPVQPSVKKAKHLNSVLMHMVSFLHYILAVVDRLASLDFVYQQMCVGEVDLEVVTASEQVDVVVVAQPVQEVVAEHS